MTPLMAYLAETTAVEAKPLKQPRERPSKHKQKQQQLQQLSQQAKTEVDSAFSERQPKTQSNAHAAAKTKASKQVPASLHSFAACVLTTGLVQRYMNTGR